MCARSCHAASYRDKPQRTKSARRSRRKRVGLLPNKPSRFPQRSHFQKELQFNILCVPVAQLNRVSLSEGEGRGFESPRAQVYLGLLHFKYRDIFLTCKYECTWIDFIPSNYKSDYFRVLNDNFIIMTITLRE